MERKVIVTKQAFSSKQSRSARALLVQNFRQEEIDCDFIISNTLNMIGKIKEFKINDQSKRKRCEEQTLNRIDQ
ncbi:hypothetical protein T06_1928 [Trichinella sp. T6]|nr:hypothetical protein T06_1928 [Trichinella sp. T6]